MQDTAFEHFFDEGLITKIIRPIKSGKEASVHLCRASPSTTGERLVALELYHPLDRRDFRDDALYRDGEWIKERRIRVAVEKKTRFGREISGGIWVDREWETLGALAGAGADVARPIARTDRAILMSYVGDEVDAAPQLRSLRADRAESEELSRQVIRNVELFLYRNVIHGDLSACNVLVWEGRMTLIDLPQAVDLRKNKHAHPLLERDVRRICEHFAASGVRSSPARAGVGSLDGVAVRGPGAGGAAWADLSATRESRRARRAGRLVARSCRPRRRSRRPARPR